MAETRPIIIRALRAIALAVTATVPLVCVPGFEAPFSIPKLVLLVYWTAIGGLSVLLVRPRRHNRLSVSAGRLWLLGLVWIVWVSLSATFGAFASPGHLLLDIVPVACFFIFVSLAPDVRQGEAALVVPGALIALIAVLQRLGADPFSLFGWTPALAGESSDRLRVYATLGNPNFVAAFLCGIAPLWWSMAGTLSRAGHRRLF